MTPPTYDESDDEETRMSSQHPDHERRRRDPLGIVSLAAGAAAHLLGLLSTLVAAVLSVRGLLELTGVSSTISLLLGTLLGLTAIGFGVAALLRRTPGRAVAGAGIALGAAELVTAFAGAIYPIVFALGIG